MYCVTDTHALLWYVTSDTRLSAQGYSIFASAEKGEIAIVVPAMVLLECIDVFDKKKVRFDFQGLILKIAESRNFIIAELNWNLILEVERTKGFRDIHDRIIVATARLFDAPLLSRDRIIRRVYGKTIW